MYGIFQDINPSVIVLNAAKNINAIFSDIKQFINFSQYRLSVPFSFYFINISMQKENQRNRMSEKY